MSACLSSARHTVSTIEVIAKEMNIKTFSNSHHEGREGAKQAWPCRVEAGQRPRDWGHFEPSGTEPWETDRNVLVAAPARKTLLSPLQKIRTMATRDSLGSMSELTRTLVIKMTNTSAADATDACYVLLCLSHAPIHMLKS